MAAKFHYLKNLIPKSPRSVADITYVISWDIWKSRNSKKDDRQLPVFGKGAMTNEVYPFRVAVERQKVTMGKGDLKILP